MESPTPDALAERYRNLPEAALMKLARGFDSLTATAQEALKAEFRHRALEPPLMDDEDDGPESSHATPTVVGRFRDLSEAIVARAVLEAAGIRCFLRDENVLRLDWSISNALGGIRLQVSSEDAEEAKRILAAPRPASFEVDSGPDFVQPVCPQCGSLDVIADDNARKIALASTLAPGMPLVIGVPALALQPEGVWKCMNCGCRWQDDEDEEAGHAGPLAPSE